MTFLRFSLPSFRKVPIVNGGGGGGPQTTVSTVTTQLDSCWCYLDPFRKKEKESQKKDEIRQAPLRKEPLTLPHGYSTKGLKGSFRAKIEPHRLTL